MDHYLFNLVVSSLQPVNHFNTCIKYVDDCTFVIPNFRNSNSTCLEEHRHMISWASSAGLRINYRKCKHLWIAKSTACSPPIIPNVELVQELKILGLHFTSDLKWSKHVKQINKSTSRRMYALRVLKPILDPTSLKRVYHGLILSIIEYCSPLMVGMLAKDETLHCSKKSKQSSSTHSW